MFPHLVPVSNFVEFSRTVPLANVDYNMDNGNMKREREVIQIMRELFLETVELTDQSGAVRRFHYSILIGAMNVGAYACESYGVKVAEQDGEQALVENITCSASRIDELCGLLVRNGVAPAALGDVVSDWL